jgi:hypothetical protein
METIPMYSISSNYTSELNFFQHVLNKKKIKRLTYIKYLLTINVV